MPAECRFTLPNGRKCRCSATRGHAFCRHHGAPSQPRSLPDHLLWKRLTIWRTLGRELQDVPVVDIPGELLTLLQSLLDNEVSDRFAGRALRVLLVRYGSVPFQEERPSSPIDLPEPPPSKQQLLEQYRSLFAVQPHPQPAAIHPRPAASSNGALR